jgi:hypothetical protein
LNGNPAFGGIEGDWGFFKGNPQLQLAFGLGFVLFCVGFFLFLKENSAEIVREFGPSRLIIIGLYIFI